MAAGVGDGRPVGVQQIIQVGRVHCGIGVGAQGVGVQLDQPGSGFLPDAEGHDDHRRHHRRPDHAHQDALAVFPVTHPGHQNGRQAQEAQHQRLGLDQRAQHVHRQRRCPFAPDGQPGHQHQPQGQHAVHLAPGRAVDDDRRIEGDQQTQKPRLVPAELPLPGKAVDKHSHHQIAEHGYRLVHQHLRPPLGEQPGHQPVQTQHIQIGRGVIAKAIRLVEVQRAFSGHHVAPGQEAVHIHLIAFHHRADQPHRQGCHQADHQEGRHALLFCQLPLVPLQRAHHERSHRRIYGGKHQKPRPEGRRLPIVIIVHIGHGRFRLEPEGRHLVAGNGVHLRERQVVKGRPALALAAVAAHPGKDRHVVLVFARLAVELHILPFALGLVHALAEHVHALDGQVRALAAVQDTVGADPAGQAVERLRLHRDGLGEAGVVHADVVDHGGMLAGAGILIHAVQGEALLANIGVGIPAVGQAVLVQIFKSAVVQKVVPGLLRCRGANSRQHQRQAQYQQPPDIRHRLSVMHPHTAHSPDRKASCTWRRPSRVISTTSKRAAQP